jgi:signal recognition particle GTPase
LTKFDTVSDKVGAALTMTHVTNAPILFVGTGQKYHHLKKPFNPIRHSITLSIIIKPKDTGKYSY